MKGFPITVVQEITPDAFFKVHGEENLGSVGTFGPATLPSGAQTGGGYPLGSVQFNVMKSYYVKEIWFSSNKNMIVNIYPNPTTPTGIGNALYSNYRSFVAAGTVWRIGVDKIYSGTNHVNMSFFMTICTDTDLTNAYANFGVVSTVIADDLNFSADKKMMWIGDSIPNGAAISSSKLNSFVFGTWKYLRETLGYNVQLISKCYSGQSSLGSEYLRSQGKFNVKQIDIIFYGHGVNDTNSTGSGQTSQTVFQSNLDALKKWRDKIYPNIPLIILGPTSCQNTTRESQLTTLRGWESSWVVTQVTAGDTHVYYCSLGSVSNVPYDPTVAGNYLSTDTAGDKVHQIESLQPAIATIITNFLTANSITI